MWTLEQVRAEYRRLDRLLGIDTSGIPVRFSKRMTRQYGVCTFLKNRPQEIRLADFLRQEDAVFWDTARHEYAHAAAALLTGKRHGHDEVWRAVCRRIGCPEDRLAPQCAAAEENRKCIAAARGVHVVTCLGCGAESRYLRRGKVVQALEEKKRHYEGVLQRELDGLDDEFSVLKLLSQELQVRANGIRNLRFRQRAA